MIQVRQVLLFPPQPLIGRAGQGGGRHGFHPLGKGADHHHFVQVRPAGGQAAQMAGLANKAFTDHRLQTPQTGKGHTPL